MSPDPLPYAPVILKLLQDVLYYDDKHWSTLLNYTVPLQRHFADIGLALHLDEAEGYAYLTQPEADPQQTPLPRLVRRVPLTYDATLLCVLLRESLQQFDAQHPDLTRHILSQSQIQEMMHIFLGEQSDMTRLTRRVNNAINQVGRLSFLKKLKGNSKDPSYEVRRIIKAKISADVLVQIKEQLQTYTNQEETDDE